MADTTNEKKLSKRELINQQIATLTATVVENLSIDDLGVPSVKDKDAKSAFEHVVEACGSTMEEQKKAEDIKAIFAATATSAIHQIAGQAMRLNRDITSVEHSFPMVGRSHLDITAHRDGNTDIRMVSHSVNAGAGALKEVVGSWSAAMAIFDAQESSSDEVAAKKEKAKA